MQLFPNCPLVGNLIDRSKVWFMIGECVCAWFSHWGPSAVLSRHTPSSKGLTVFYRSSSWVFGVFLLWGIGVDGQSFLGA